MYNQLRIYDNQYSDSLWTITAMGKASRKNRNGRYNRIYPFILLCVMSAVFPISANKKSAECLFINYHTALSAVSVDRMYLDNDRNQFCDYDGNSALSNTTYFR